MYKYQKNNKWIFIGGIVLIFVIGLGMFFFSKSGDAKEPIENLPEMNTTQVGDASVDPEIADDKEEGKTIDSSQLNQLEGKSNGIDVSKWQGKINWNKVKNNNIDFAFIRIGYRGENGVLYKDDNADYNIQQAEKAGVLVGVYFYSTAINEKEAIEEANWTRQCIEGYSISYPVVFDCENYKNPSSRTHSLSVEERTNNAIAYLNTINNAGYETMFYTSLHDTHLYWNISQIEKKAKIWIAQYSDIIYPQKNQPDYSGKVHAWQYTNKGHVNGISGNVDMVVCYFKNDKAKPKNSKAKIPNVSAPLTDEEKLYSSVNEKVTAKQETNLRKSATTKSDIVTILKNGETVTRIGIGKNGWSKLKYKNQTVYAITSYLTTDLTIKEEPKDDIVNGQKFESKNDKVTAKEEVNLRSLPSTNSEVVGKLVSGDFLKRTAISSNGWSRLTYNGQTVYAITSYLSNKVVEKPKEPEQPVSDGFTSVNEQVTAKTETNLRDKPSTNGSNIIYTLKNGEYVKRIGIHSNGWSKLEYNGQIVYAVSSYLTK